jgi:iron complex transport system substrate-binding protein
MAWQSRKILKGYKFLSIFLVIITFLSVVACNTNIVEREARHTSPNVLRSAVETKVVNDALGKVEIPINPKRIVVLDEHQILDPVLALGIKPIGVISCQGCEEDFRGIPNELVSGISRVGYLGEPSLEKIAALKPDLILARTWIKDSYDILSRIAPTIIIDSLNMYNFKERLKYIAQVLERNSRAEELLIQYQGRIRELREKLGDQIETKTISMIYVAGSADIFYSYKPTLFTYGQIIEDVGLKLPLDQQNQKEWELTLSIEVLPKYDADFLFIMTEQLSTEFKDANSKSLSFLKHPIWSQLKAVKNNQVYKVNWTVGGPIGANRVIDDLFKYLVNTP